MFEVLVVTEVLLCLLLMAAAVHALAEVAPSAPELDLGRRAWVAASFSMAEASALGPLFKHLVRASRQGLRQAHCMQERLRKQRERRSSGPFGPLAALCHRWRTRRSSELAELSHLVEQLEQMGRGVARYRAGLGMLMDLHVPMRCVQVPDTSSTRHRKLV